MANKMTKKEVINGILNGSIKVSDEVAQAYFQNELALLEKKAQNKKATKTQEANVGIKAEIKAVLASAEKAMTVTEIQSASASLGALSNQKVSALLKQLVEANVVTKVIDKKVSRFSVSSEEEEE